MERESLENPYDGPVERLLALGEPLDGEWCDYPSLGITAEHIPALIQMALDVKLHDAPTNSPEVWAPIRAWRALGQLRASEAIAPLLTLFQRTEDGDDWVQSDLPEALGKIGAPVIEPAAAYLAETRHSEWARSAAAETLGKIAESYPELRAQCVAKLAAQLEKFSEQSEMLNALLVLPLWDLRAVETMPVIERAFAAGRVDESLLGDVEDVQIHFGLKQQREHPPKRDGFWDFQESIDAMRNEINALELENARLREAIQDVVPQPYVAPPKIGRNDPCPCGSGKKHKKCCGK